MQTAYLFRGGSTDQGTPGFMCLAGLVLHSLELPWRGNLRSVSRIPPGRYRCKRVKSPRFGDVFQVLDVPDRSAILIHWGNFAGRVQTWDSNVEGCIELGEKAGHMVNTKGSMQQCVLSSRPAVRRFMEAVNADEFDLEIMEFTQ